MSVSLSGAIKSSCNLLSLQMLYILCVSIYWLWYICAWTVTSALHVCAHICSPLCAKMVLTTDTCQIQRAAPMYRFLVSCTPGSVFSHEKCNQDLFMWTETKPRRLYSRCGSIVLEV